MFLTQALHRMVQQDRQVPMTVHAGRVRTAAEVADRVSRLAGALRALGVASGDRVGILALNCDRYTEILLAVPWADAVVLPVNTRWSPAEIAFSLRDSGTRVLLADDAFAGLVPELRAGVPDLHTVVFCGDAEVPDATIGYEDLVAGGEPAEDARRRGAALAGIFYTGGTTGTPKGVMLSHDGMVTSALGCLATGGFVTPHARLLHAAPMFHLADLAAWVAGLQVGATHISVPAFTPAGVLAAVAEHHVTDVLLVPTMVQLLVDHPGVAQADLGSLRRIIYGASPMPEAVLERARTLLPHVGFTQGYGMTELSPVTTLLLPSDHDNPTLRRSAGRAVPHAEVRVVDPDSTEVPRGTVGEVVARGDHVMLGYWRRPEETADAIRDDWMHTGDAGHMDERGYLFIVDRLKEMIITGGENVYPAEVENVLARHPAVATCAVIGLPDEQWGERVHAVVVPRDGHTIELADLAGFCRAHIASYKAPRSLSLASQLPLSGAGKVLKRQLRAQLVDAEDRP